MDVIDRINAGLEKWRQASGLLCDFLVQFRLMRSKEDGYGVERKDKIRNE